MAGVYFAFSTSVMGGAAPATRPGAIATMQSINEVIMNPLFLLLFIGSGLSCAALGGDGEAQRPATALGPDRRRCLVRRRLARADRRDQRATQRQARGRRPVERPRPRGVAGLPHPMDGLEPRTRRILGDRRDRLTITLASRS